MAIDYDKLVNWQIPEVEQRLTRRDTILYALGVGLGADPCDVDQLRFVYEDGLRALPTMAIILGYPGAWHAHPDTGITRGHVVHGEQEFRIVKPLPVEGDVLGKTRVTGLVDKGPAKGALLMTDCTVRDKASGEVLCTLTSTSFCRADGGFGGPGGPVRTPHRIPDTPTARVRPLHLPQAALIYRLSGDNHAARRPGVRTESRLQEADPARALHVQRRRACDTEDVVRLRARALHLHGGAILRTGVPRRDDPHRDVARGNVFLFRATVPARGATVLDNGKAEIR
jgi:hypothetical protein